MSPIQKFYLAINPFFLNFHHRFVTSIIIIDCSNYDCAIRSCWGRKSFKRSQFVQNLMLQIFIKIFYLLFVYFIISLYFLENSFEITVIFKSSIHPKISYLKRTEKRNRCNRHSHICINHVSYASSKRYATNIQKFESLIIEIVDQSSRFF